MTTKGRILIADDEEFFLRITTEFLSKEGYECSQADLPPFFVPPLKLEFLFKQTVSATLQLSV